MIEYDLFAQGKGEIDNKFFINSTSIFIDFVY